MSADRHLDVLLVRRSLLKQLLKRGFQRQGDGAGPREEVDVGGAAGGGTAWPLSRTRKKTAAVRTDIGGD
jgi:hypothetical protein